MPDQKNLETAEQRAATQKATQEAFEKRCAPPETPPPSSVVAPKPLDKEAWEQFVQRCADADKPLPTPMDDVACLRSVAGYWKRCEESKRLCVRVERWWLPIGDDPPVVKWFAFPGDLGPLRVDSNDPDVKRAAELVALAKRERAENEELEKVAEASRVEYRAKQEKVLATRRKEVERRGA